MHPAQNKINEFIGLPYEPPRGCWVLVRDVYRTILNIELPDYSQLHTREEFTLMVLKEKANWVPVVPEYAHIRPYDAVHFTAAGLPHIGVMVTQSEFLHVTSEHATSRVEQLFSYKWLPRIISIHRYAGC